MKKLTEKPIPKKLQKDFESFVNSTHFTKRRLYPQYNTKHSLKILDFSKDEKSWLCNFDNTYLLYIEIDKSLKNFGGIFNSNLKSSKDIPWPKKN